MNLNEQIPEALSLDEVEIENLMRTAGADPSDSGARKWLRSALEMLPHIVRVKAAKAPQAVRNTNLKKVAEAGLRLRNAYSALDGASRAALFEASWGGASRAPQFSLADDEDGLDPQHDVLSRLLGAATQDPSVMGQFLERLATLAEAAQIPTQPGRLRNEGAYEAVKLLASFVEQYGTITVSTTEQGQFHRFAQQALRLVTGREHDLLNAIRERGRN